MAPPRLQAMKQSKEMHPAVALSSGWRTSDSTGEVSRQIITCTYSTLDVYITGLFPQRKAFSDHLEPDIHIFVALEDQCWLVYPEGYKDQPVHYTVKDYAQIIIIQPRSPKFRP